MSRRVVVVGMNANPIGLHQMGFVAALRECYDEVIVVPCGPRPDKPAVDDVDPVHRAAMVQLAFRGWSRVRLDLSDLEQRVFTPMIDLVQRYEAEGNDVSIAVDATLTIYGSTGASRIQQCWKRGAELWSRANFAVAVQRDDVIPPSEFPLHYQRVIVPTRGTSRDIRSAIFSHQHFRHLVPKPVADYIERWKLYRGVSAPSMAEATFDLSRAMVVFDERNERAVALANRLGFPKSMLDPSCIVTIGGDGTMLHAVRTHWEKRVPFIGVNKGHKGYLLNDATDEEWSRLLTQKFAIYQQPLLYVEVDDGEGRRHASLAFNDAWVERATTQTAWLEVMVNDRVQISKLSCDAALLATVVGSTAYARNMGGPALPVDTNAFVLAGSNTARHLNWFPTVLSGKSRVQFTTLDTEKRPVNGVIDGVLIGPSKTMRIRRSSIAAVQLAFLPDRPLDVKIAEEQFPR